MQTSSERLNRLPKYLFADLDEKKRRLAASGVDVIDLGIGDPDLPPPKRMIEALTEALQTNSFHRYPPYNGADFFRNAVSEWLKNEHHVSVDHTEEILALIGSKEGLSHMPLALLNQGDKVLITDPCYPPHLQSLLLAGAVPQTIKLREENGFIPDLRDVPEEMWKSAKLIVLNYPNNPTSATATRTFFEEVVALAHKYNFIICHDSAYIDICLEGERQPCLLSVEGAKDVAVEFFTLSKMFNICGWRLGFCAGRKEIIASLSKLKIAVDSGQFSAIQKAGEIGLKECLPFVQETVKTYKKRKNIFTSALEKMGLKYFRSNSTFYVWVRTPAKFRSIEYTNLLLEKAGIVAAPGIGFGKEGDEYIRFSLTQPTEKIEEAAERMRKLL